MEWFDDTGAYCQVFMTKGEYEWKLVLPGEACHARRLQELLELPGDIKRLDLKMDTEGECTPGWLHDVHQAGKVVSRCRNWLWIQSGQVTEPDLGQNTFSLGRRGGSFYLRVYDRGAKALGLPPGSISRWEIELRRETARKAWRELKPRALGRSPTAEQLCARIIASKVRVCDGPVDRASNNQAHSRIDAAWAAFIGDPDRWCASTPALGNEERSRRRTKALRHFERTLAFIVEAFGEETLLALATKGRARLDDTDASQLSSASARGAASEVLADILEDLDQAADDEFQCPGG